MVTISVSSLYLHPAYLVGWEDLSKHLGDADLLGDGSGSLLVVSGEQNDVEAALLEGVDCQCCLRLDSISHGQHPYQLT